MIHAEANCMSLFKKGEARLIAVTLLPCSYCATMKAAYGIPLVVYSEEYERDVQAREIFNFYKIELDQKYWNYSNTTGKYRNIFLGETITETKKKIKSGEYILTDLNK